MLFWEFLHKTNTPTRLEKIPDGSPAPAVTQRLPYDTQCSATTKVGARCRGRIRQGRDFCPFHDPELLAKRHHRMSETGAKHRRARLSHIHDGYLRKLKSRAAIGEAMDRLYREVRMGAVSLEMGTVLLGILSRLLQSDLIKSGPCPERSKAARIMPKLTELLTRGERKALRTAMEHDQDRIDGPRPTRKRARPHAQRHIAAHGNNGITTRGLVAAS